MGEKHCESGTVALCGSYPADGGVLCLLAIAARGWKIQQHRLEIAQVIHSPGEEGTQAGEDDEDQEDHETNTAEETFESVAAKMEAAGLANQEAPEDEFSGVEIIEAGASPHAQDGDSPAPEAAASPVSIVEETAPAPDGAPRLSNSKLTLPMVCA